jgi:glucosamine--fructose-6-phosphate aminotransferase (isomerizing)
MSDKKYDAVLDASDAADLTKLFVALTPPFTPELLNGNCGGLQTPQALLNCAVSMLTHSIDQLTRPIDAIRHQAKTVTVGISGQMTLYCVHLALPMSWITALKEICWSFL